MNTDWLKTKYTCSLCGRQTDVTGSVIPTEYQGYILCIACGQMLYTCGTCKHNACGVDNALHGGQCPVSPVVQVVTQDGFMTMERPEINPRLVDIYCEDCICRDDKRCVHFTVHSCDKYEIMEKKYK